MGEPDVHAPTASKNTLFFLISNKLFEGTQMKTSSTPIVKSNYTIIIGSLHTSELRWKRIGTLQLSKHWPEVNL